MDEQEIPSVTMLDQAPTIPAGSQSAVFSLRSLFVVTTVICLVSAIFPSFMVIALFVLLGTLTTVVLFNTFCMAVGLLVAFTFMGIASLGRRARHALTGPNDRGQQ
jgi:hypothetical protein